VISRMKLTPLFLQTLLLILTISLGLFAMTFTPYEKIYIDGAWYTQFDLDPLYAVRRCLMIYGFVVCILSPCLLAYELIRKKWRGNDIVLHLSMVLLSCTIGWAAYPYWVNGMFQAYIGRAPWGDFDPRPLIMHTWVSTWIAPGWPIGVLILFLVSLLAIPSLLLLALIFSIRERIWSKGIATALNLGMTAAFFFLSPNYWRWFWD
jgi:hypothetical protein